MANGNKYSEKRRRIYRWFFTEYNHQWINYKKFYVASSGTRKYARILNYAIGITGSAIVLIILAIVRGYSAELLEPASLAAALIVGLLSATDSVGDFERKHVRYYSIGQRMDDLYTQMDYMVNIRLPDPTEDDDELAKECLELVERKDDLNGNAPELPEKWYKKLKEREHEESGGDDEDPLTWERPNLEELQ